MPGQRRMVIQDEDFHFLISELRDENSKGRMREALWISIIVHMILIATIRSAPVLFPTKTPVRLLSQQEQLKQRDLTFTELPPDLQKPTQRPDTNKISDKDRTAASRNPQIDKRALERLAKSGLTGAAGANPKQPQAPPQQAQNTNPQAEQQQGQQSQQGQPRQNSEQVARMDAPPLDPANAFKIPTSAGAAIQEAARASARAPAGGVGGDYGGGPGLRNVPTRSNIDILSDTMGVDFSPYLQRVLQSVRINWYNLIPEEARTPLFKQGKVAIEFLITKDGAIAGMRLVGPSGDVALDRAAWGGITASNPFPPLPGEFRGDNIALRFHFFYNPKRSELQ